MVHYGWGSNFSCHSQQLFGSFCSTLSPIAHIATAQIYLLLRYFVIKLGGFTSDAIAKDLPAKNVVDFIIVANYYYVCSNLWQHCANVIVISAFNPETSNK